MSERLGYSGEGWVVDTPAVESEDAILRKTSSLWKQI
jgi:hypothetical protein